MVWCSICFPIGTFFGFLFLLLANNLTDKLLSADFYSNIISGQDTYDRIYDEVLLDEELARTTQDLLGNVQVPQEEIVSLLREIMPRDYLQSQVEGSIQRTVDYFKKDLERLELYVELGPREGEGMIVVYSGLDGSESYIVNGMLRARPGFPVTPQAATAGN